MGCIHKSLLVLYEEPFLKPPGLLLCPGPLGAPALYRTKLFIEP